MRRRVDCFPDGHPGYADWIAEFPQGYVLTIRDPETAPVLHRADCPYVSSPAYDNRGPVNVRNGVPGSDRHWKIGSPDVKM
jgi:hypothetical protein